MKLPDISAIQSDEALRQREFPVCADKVYLAHAGVSPLPACVERAVNESVSTGTRNDQEEGLAELLRETRTRAAATPRPVLLSCPSLAPSAVQYIHQIPVYKKLHHTVTSR